MSQQQPLPAAMQPGALSRIPNLATHRSLANSRLPSPPVSPGISSPSTPAPAGQHVYGISSGGGSSSSGQAAAPWASTATGTPQGPRLPASSTKSSGWLSSSANGSALPNASTPGATPGSTSISAGGRGYSGSASALPRNNDSVRASATGLAARTPNSSQGAASGGGLAFGVAPPSPLLLPEVMVGPPASSAPAAAAVDMSYGGTAPSSSRSSIQVAVRIRPLCDKERQRGDRVAWEADRDGNVGVLDSVGAFVPKHRFDTVFGADADNCSVTAHVALPLVAPALRGVNGTIFAYGVTSSGKTHTMMGTDKDPGVVPRVVRELFAQISAAEGAGAGGAAALSSSCRVYSVRMSMMEIYNEVLNDLLDPTRINLKVREDSRSGLVLVEGLLEQAVLSAEQALELIARGDHNRKVGATAFNEDSSRSHTITRIIIESTLQPQQPQQHPGAAAAAAATASGGGGELSFSLGGDRPVSRRTTACLSLIDLAGSESARAVVSKGQRMEGSFINRSLLTLGTVIHKLAAGATGHVPFRDSKLTRLLQPSLSGPGARVAVVCNITPAAAQSDETANTLKFASRAKLIQVTARTNEILDERSLLRHYQKEVADLKRQLAEAKRQLAAAGVSAGGGAGADGESVAAAGVAAPSQGGGVDVGGGGGGGVSPEEAAAAALQAERDARRAVEIEATMTRIKLARLQAFLEENGVDVDNILIVANAATGETAIGGDSGGGGGGGVLSDRQGQGESAPLRSSSLSHRSSSCFPGYDAPSPSPFVKPPAEAVQALRHAISTPRLDGSECGAGSWDVVAGGGAGGGNPRASPLRRSLDDSEPVVAGAAAAIGRRWPNWSSDQQAAGRRAAQGGSAQSSPSTSTGTETETVGLVAGGGGGETTTSAELRMQVAAALYGGGGGSASGTPSVSDLDVDELDLNEGIMAQIRDMITEAQLASPHRPHAIASPPAGGAGAAAAAATAEAFAEPHLGGSSRPGTAGGRRTPGGVSAAASGGGTLGRGASAGGPASCVSSQHRLSATLSTASSSYGAGIDLDLDLELQVLNADREVLHDQLVASEAANERLTAQVSDLRRQLSTYEQLTRHAASELAEIRRLKEAFQARLQRENDALRAQLAALVMAPAAEAAGAGIAPAGPPPAASVAEEPQSPRQPRPVNGKSSLGAPKPMGLSAAGQSGWPGAAATVHRQPPLHNSAQRPPPLPIQEYHFPQRQQQSAGYDVPSMEAFGSPADLVMSPMVPRADAASSLAAAASASARSAASGAAGTGVEMG